MARLPRSSIARRRAEASRTTTLSKRASANRNNLRATTSCLAHRKRIRGRSRTSTNSNLPLSYQLTMARRILNNWTLPSSSKSRKTNLALVSSNLQGLMTKCPSTKVRVRPRRRQQRWRLNPRPQARRKRNPWTQPISHHFPTILATQNRCTPTLLQSLHSRRRLVSHQAIPTKSIRTCGSRCPISVDSNIRISLQWLMDTASMVKRSVISSNRSCRNILRHRCATCSKSILRICRSIPRMRHSILTRCVLHSTTLSSTATTSSFQE